MTLGGPLAPRFFADGIEKIRDRLDTVVGKVFGIEPEFR